ncbi:amidase family protein [Erysipelothrix rhusiopathiae]|uniref:Aspartyl/glutamyl-tRNA amidotransferase subunit A n=1 Tax=Erysipelothrix rhusiopathiae ATCC 19414 TaxID=525280 RepID=E7FXK8_ERYRH|nr:amidase family protein [Erysipelothrix rhusiopathiae]EFY08232.1 aspartyl/glutamyl-tRNA amidotransferase subunit A [Erysipelothrix rhusiopathiae ATCC 19414]MDE8256243.1 amidase family protein [Erysipelothrix rhusiopathiae]MDE8340571.1 amidase family protein [Erysipelothrix rhusiopathiae]MDV7680473.1 Asp-tRNA(Asn)/Glu-tRNA(Gln) amidotransferase subunit GatA [Erysipelothrix rhusiopathiae]RNM26433.1 Asp-tRNA(Asn)/Glu-tRNA(Gln) amidotransferase subunit GatA [Erysipelothrix rhusiopathiae]
MSKSIDEIIGNLKKENERLNAIVSFVDPNEVTDGLISGWDIALKDNINMKDTLTTASCKLLSNHKSIYNAHVVDRLLDEGAVIVAKTSMDELGMGGTNLSAITGPVYNPYDITRISGGSSGGSAALVGAKAVRAALGSDTGDSVRKPAAYCGAVGVKPTYGRISRYGVIPYASSLDHVGYFTQNVADAACLLEVLAGRDDRDMTSSMEPVVSYSKLLDMDLEGKRIGIFKTVEDAIENEAVKATFVQFKEKLEAQGAILVEKTIEKTLMRTMLPVYSVISNSEAVANHANLDGVRFGLSQEGDSLEEIMKNTRTNGFSSLIKRRFIFGAFALDDANQKEVFDQAKKVRRLLVNAYASCFEDVDIMVTLASGTVAPKVENQLMDELSDAYLIGENHMVINNFSGYPSMTLPLDLVDGLPVGINISTQPFTEAKMFAYGQAFESLINWKGAF